MEYDRYGGGSVMVCCSIPLDGRTEFQVFDRGALIAVAVRYRNEVLQPI